MKDFSFVDETIDLNRAHSYGLSIQFSLNGFSFSILDLVRRKFVALKHTDLAPQNTFDQKGDRVQQILDTDPHLRAEFKQTAALVVNPKSVLIPAAFFRAEDLKKYLQFNHDLHEMEEIHYNYINAIEAYTVFPLPNPVSNAMIEKFSKINYYHQAVPTIDYCMNQSHEGKKYFALSIYDHFIDIVMLSDTKLHFYNSFFWSSYEDILYYLLYTFKQLQMDVATDYLYITGNTGSKQELKKLLKQYIKKVHLHKPPSDFTYSYTIKKDRINHFTNLFRLNLCV